VLKPSQQVNNFAPSVSARQGDSKKKAAPLPHDCGSGLCRLSALNHGRGLPTDRCSFRQYVGKSCLFRFKGKWN